MPTTVFTGKGYSYPWYPPVGEDSHKTTDHEDYHAIEHGSVPAQTLVATEVHPDHGSRVVKLNASTKDEFLSHLTFKGSYPPDGFLHSVYQHLVRGRDV